MCIDIIEQERVTTVTNLISGGKSDD